MKINKTCPICDKSFQTTQANINYGRGKVCSTDCQYESMRRRAKFKTLTCDHCGKEFTRPAWKRPYKKTFCCYKCKADHMRGPQYPITCTICGTVFSVPKSRRSRAVACSKKCWSKYMSMNFSGKNSHLYKERVPHQCERCGKTQMVTPQKKKTARFCCHTCKILWQFESGNLDNSGAKNANWQGGVTHWTQRFYQSSTWRKIRAVVLKRDNYTCQKCGKYSKKRLLVHHVESYRFGKNNSLDNLTTLCKKCHGKMHCPPGHQRFKP